MSDERLAELRASAEQWEVLTIRESRELLAEVEALRAEASLGAALRAAIAELGEWHDLQIFRPLDIRGQRQDFYVDRRGPDESRISCDATRHLASLLSALPVVEDAADHRKEERND